MAIRHPENLEVTRVQHELGRGVFSIDGERRRAAEALLDEVRPEVERDVRHASFRRPGKRVDVPIEHSASYRPRPTRLDSDFNRYAVRGGQDWRRR
jgi:hypothetical protein